MKYKETPKIRPNTPKPLPTTKIHPYNQSDSNQIILEEARDSTPFSEILCMGDIELIEDSNS